LLLKTFFWANILGKKSCPNFGHFGQNRQHVAKSATFSNIKQHFIKKNIFNKKNITSYGNKNIALKNGHFFGQLLKSSKCYFINFRIKINIIIFQTI